MWKRSLRQKDESHGLCWWNWWRGRGSRFCLSAIFMRSPSSCLWLPCSVLVNFLKGKFPQTTMWIGWVESNFSKPNSESLEQIWIIHLSRSDYAKLCTSPSLDGTLPEYVISQEDNYPLTLYIDFQIFWFLGYQQSFWSSSFINACTFISALTYLHVNCIKEEGRYFFMKSNIFTCTLPLDSCTVVTSQILEECHLRGRHTQH